MIAEQTKQRYYEKKLKSRQVYNYLANTNKDKNIHELFEVIKNLDIPGVAVRSGDGFKKRDSNFRMDFKYPDTFSKYVIEEEEDKNE